jgi:hypothetical protein
LAAAACVGCGDDSGLPRRYHVSGTVTYNGKRLEKGTMNFTPDGTEGRAAGGTITDGQYSLTTHHPDDGAVPGKYKVSIMAKEADPSKVEVKVKRPGKQALTEAQQNAIRLQFREQIAGKADAAAKSLIPVKYSSPELSGLTFEVKQQSNSANFDLKD